MGGTIRYASVCDGISAVSVAWRPVGWECAWVSEIDPFACAVLADRWPDHHNVGDMLAIDERIRDRGPIDIFVGGTPCQSFSVAGLRRGLDDARGNLALRFVQLARLLRPRWIVWENVPGVLSSNRGWDFGAIVGALEHCGYGIAWRILDAQFHGVPQRRRRVFVVGHLGDWRRAAAVLFDATSLRGDSAARGKARPTIARTLASRTRGGGGLGTDFECDGGLIAGTVSAKWAKGTGGPSGDECQNLIAATVTTSPYCDGDEAGGRLVAHTLRGEGFDASEDGLAYTLEARHRPQSVLPSPLLAVRRLTPRECERLQGFPDQYTLITYRGKPAADGPRYKAIGNSMAVPVMRWIGERIAFVDGI